MILSDKDIRERVKSDNLIIGFDEDNLQSASYDITITKKIQRFVNEFRRVDLNNKDSIDRIYEEIDITFGYDLRPNESIYVTLNETVNMPEDLVAHIRPRTTFIRLGLVLSSQHINPTYNGNLSLGLYNSTPFVIELLPNMKIGQLVFETLSSIPTESKQYKNKYDSKYQNEKGFTGSKVYDEVVAQKIRKYLDSL